MQRRVAEVFGAGANCLPLCSACPHLCFEFDSFCGFAQVFHAEEFWVWLFCSLCPARGEIQRRVGKWGPLLQVYAWFDKVSLEAVAFRARLYSVSSSVSQRCIAWPDTLPNQPFTGEVSDGLRYADAALAFENAYWKTPAMNRQDWYKYTSDFRSFIFQSWSGLR